ncbi:MAG: gliding motility-associated C-terminal domain-containing protein, partial [Bacteroidota bacterium]
IQNSSGSIGFTVPSRNAVSWSVGPNNPEGWQYIPTSSISYLINPIPFKLEPIIPGDKIDYRWYEGSSSEPFAWDSVVVVSPDTTTTYKVTATICSGQVFTDYVTVNVVNPVPDAFTPNGDGINDDLRIIGESVDPLQFQKYSLKIYNRWGQEVFTSSNIEEKWNGRMNNTGELCPDGAYVWVIYYEKANGTKVTNKGMVTLLR